MSRGCSYTVEKKVDGAYLDLTLRCASQPIPAATAAALSAHGQAGGPPCPESPSPVEGGAITGPAPPAGVAVGAEGGATVAVGGGGGTSVGIAVGVCVGLRCLSGSPKLTHLSGAYTSSHQAP